MAKITRVTASIFGSNAGVDQIAQFGSLAAGTPAFSTNPATIQALSEWQSGWFSAATGGLNSPAIEDMNAVHYVNSYQIAYVLQQGVPEWDSGTTYFTNNIVSSSGVLYVSLNDNNFNNPTSNGAHWQQLISFSNGILADGTVPMQAPLKFPNGSAAIPSVTFSSDNTTGIYRPSSATIGFSVSSGEVMEIGASKVLYFQPIQAANGTAVTPAVGIGGLTTGLYSFGANSLGFTTNSLTAGHIDSSQNWTFVGTITASNFSGTSSGTNTGNQTITLTGDVTGSGTGSFAATLATVNSNTGSFGSSTAIPSFTVNGKGLITAASTNAVIAPAGTLTGTTLASNVVTSSLTTVGTLASPTLTTPTINQPVINGLTDGSSAAAGVVGEVLTAFSGGGGSPAYVNAGSTGQFFDVASVTLTAGDWDIYIMGSVKLNGATVTEAAAGIGTATGNSGAGMVNDENFGDVPIPSATNAPSFLFSWHASLSGSTTYYFKGFASFTVATPQMRGTIWARRRR